jgi:hypothetical protein
MDAFGIKCRFFAELSLKNNDSHNNDIKDQKNEGYHRTFHFALIEDKS